jgi:hypothetical protein
MADAEHDYEALPQRTNIRGKRAGRQATQADWPAADDAQPGKEQQQQQPLLHAAAQPAAELQGTEDVPDAQQQQQQQQQQQRQQQQQQQVAGVQTYRSAAVGHHKFECE